MTQYTIKRRYLRKLKTLGYQYNPFGKFYFLDEGDFRHLISKKTRVYELQEFKKVDSTTKFLGKEYTSKAYQMEIVLNAKPNIPKEWMKNYQKIELLNEEEA
jgi:hypothetical protein